jgi:hypothetical protein
MCVCVCFSFMLFCLFIYLVGLKTLARDWTGAVALEPFLNRPPLKVDAPRRDHGVVHDFMQNWAEKVLALICLVIPSMCRRSEQRSCRRSSRRSGLRGGAGAGAHGSRATRTLWTLKRAVDVPPLKCFQAAAASNCELIMGRFGSSSRGATCRTGSCPLPLQRRHATDLAARIP